MRLLFFISILFASLANGLRAETAGEFPVGLVRLDLTDPVRMNWSETAQRPLVTSIWYPAVDDAQMKEIGIPPEHPIFIGGFAAVNAKLSDLHEAYPIIIMSHGTGGAASQMMWLARELAAEGYIVAAVDHHGNTATEKAFDPRGFQMFWERAVDISAVLDQLLADPQWATRIDASRIGAVGFSLGGYTITALAGGRIDLAQFEAFCSSVDRDSTCDPQTEYPEAGLLFERMLESDPALRARMKKHSASYRDERIGAVVALAPALGQAFIDDSLGKIEIPYLAIVGTADSVAPSATNAKKLVASIPNARLHLLPGSGHYVFLNICTSLGIDVVAVCKDPPKILRDHVHKQVVDQTVQFFGESLDQ